MDDFFRHYDVLLQPRGTMLLQAITVTDRTYRRHTRSVDFINGMGILRRKVFSLYAKTGILRSAEGIKTHESESDRRQ